MKTFLIQVLGCKVNQYEGEQIATLLRRRGLVPAAGGTPADLRIVHTCSVTAEAGKKSGQTVRRMTRLPVLQGECLISTYGGPSPSARTIVTGCWATSDPAAAAAIPGVDAVISNDQDLPSRLSSLLDAWLPPAARAASSITPSSFPGSSSAIDLSLPTLVERQSGNQRAFLKIQDGCDAYCTYCIIPQLRPQLSSKPIDECIREAQALVDRGHAELVLTGIFLGAYSHDTALRRRQRHSKAPGERSGGGLAQLIDALCHRVTGLRRLRLSSLEPGDLDDNLIAVLRSHEQAVPHFHLPLQSGSDVILKKMNRQYRRDDFLRMIDRVNESFDRPAVTTDIIVGFPFETDAEFAETLRVAERARFIHTHAFCYSPRPKTAAARWTEQFVAPAVANDRIRQLSELAAEASLQFRRQFLGETVEVLVERPKPGDSARHGRCERYFDVRFTPQTPAAARPGTAVRLRVDRVDEATTFGSQLQPANWPLCEPTPEPALPGARG